MKVERSPTWKRLALSRTGRSSYFKQICYECLLNLNLKLKLEVLTFLTLGKVSKDELQKYFLERIWREWMRSSMKTGQCHMKPKRCPFYAVMIFQDGFTKSMTWDCFRFGIFSLLCLRPLTLSSLRFENALKMLKNYDLIFRWIFLF